jgi:hypothetical protein
MLRGAQNHKRHCGDSSRPAKGPEENMPNNGFAMDDWGSKVRQREMSRVRNKLTIYI